MIPSRQTFPTSSTDYRARTFMLLDVYETSMRFACTNIVCRRGYARAVRNCTLSRTGGGNEGARTHNFILFAGSRFSPGIRSDVYEDGGPLSGRVVSF